MIIYKLTNQINNKSYIGLTTNTLSQRLAQHAYEAKHGTDRPLYRAIRKYGIEAFSAEIIDTATNLDELKEKEQYWIEYYNTYGANGQGYNATKGGDVRTHPSVPYLQIDLKSGEIINEFSSAEECNSFCPGATQNADKVLEVQYRNDIFVKKFNVQNLSKQQIKDYAFSLRPKVICQLDKNGQLIQRWVNTSEILKVHPDYTKSCIFNCLWGNRKTHKGYMWKYYSDWRNDLFAMPE